MVTRGRGDEAAWLWDLKSAAPAASGRVLRGHESTITDVLLKSDVLITGSYDKTARVWDLTADNPGENSVVLSHDNPVANVNLSSDGRWVITTTKDKVVRHWDLQDGDPVAGNCPILAVRFQQ